MESSHPTTKGGILQHSNVPLVFFIPLA